MRTVGGVDTATPVAAGHKQRARHVWGRVGRVMFIAVMLARLADWRRNRACLADLGAGGDVGGGGAERQRAVGVDGAQNHALALVAHHVARGEVGDEQHLHAY